MISDCCGAEIKHHDICTECGEHAEVIVLCSECDEEITDPNKQKYGVCSRVCLEASER